MLRSCLDMPFNGEGKNLPSRSRLYKPSNETSIFPFHLQSNTKTLVETKTKTLTMFCTLNKAKNKT